MLGKSDWNRLKIEVSQVLLQRAFDHSVASGKKLEIHDRLQICLVSLLRIRAAQLNADFTSRTGRSAQHVTETELLR